MDTNRKLDLLFAQLDVAIAHQKWIIAMTQLDMMFNHHITDNWAEQMENAKQDIVSLINKLHRTIGDE